MPRKPDDPEQSKRSIEIAREVEAEGSKEESKHVAVTAAELTALQDELEAAILRRAEALRKAGPDSTHFKVAVSEVALLQEQIEEIRAGEPKP
jgi:hypothetical protein